MAVTKTKCLPHAPLLHWLCAESGCSDSQSSDRAMEHDWQTTEPHLKTMASCFPAAALPCVSTIDYRLLVRRISFPSDAFSIRVGLNLGTADLTHLAVQPLQPCLDSTAQTHPQFLRRPRPPTGRSMSHICDGTVMRMPLPWFTSRFDREMNAVDHARNNN